MRKQHFFKLNPSKKGKKKVNKKNKQPIINNIKKIEKKIFI